jgi:hypothetical protein
MKINNVFIVSVFSLLICFLAGCSAVKIIKVDQDASVNLKDYKTFNFYTMNIDNQTSLEPEKKNLDLLLNEIRNEMEAKNYTKAENPDLMINVGIVITEEVQTRETNINDAPRYMGQRNYHWESEEVVVGTYNDGTVAIDLVDTKTDALVYHAVARSVISSKKEKNQKRIKDAVNKIFSKFSN